MERKKKETNPGIRINNNLESLKKNGYPGRDYAWKRD